MYKSETPAEKAGIYNQKAKESQVKLEQLIENKMLQ